MGLFRSERGAIDRQPVAPFDQIMSFALERRWGRIVASCRISNTSSARCTDAYAIFAWLAAQCCERSCPIPEVDRKSTRLNSSHLVISYAVFCLKKKKDVILYDK